MELPLFPLHTVLFPGRPLPLHVFEPRYRLMIGRCLEQSAPFGVVLIRAGLEVGDPAEPHAVGTTAEIVQHERLPDGRMHLLCVGRDRFLLRRLLPGEPYLRGEVELLADEPTQADLEPQTTRLAAALGAYLGPERLAAVPIPDDPAALSFAAAALLPLSLAEQQSLLETTSAEQRLRRLLASVDRELHLRRRVGDTQPTHPHVLRRPSPN